MTSGRLVLFLAAAVVALAQAGAAPLDADTCAKLRGEHSQLELAGVEQEMEKGPEWAKANLASDKLDRIRRFIELEEQLLFRCRDKSLVSLPEEQEQTPNADNGEQDKKGAPDKKKDAPAAAKKGKAPDAATKKKTEKKTEPAKKAAVPPAPKQTTTVPKQTKQDAGAGKAKPPAKAAVKPPSDPAPPAGKAAPKAKTEEQ